MSDSLIVWNPRIEDPSKPMPSAKRSSDSSSAVIEKCCQVPGMSANRRSTISTPFSFANLITSFGVIHCLLIRRQGGRPGPEMKLVELRKICHLASVAGQRSLANRPPDKQQVTSGQWQMTNGK